MNTLASIKAETVPDQTSQESPGTGKPHRGALVRAALALSVMLGLSGCAAYPGMDYGSNYQGSYGRPYGGGYGGGIGRYANAYSRYPRYSGSRYNSHGPVRQHGSSYGVQHSYGRSFARPGYSSGGHSRSVGRSGSNHGGSRSSHGRSGSSHGGGRSRH
jgi:hypothetical protein